MADMLRLHLGCGNTRQDGWVNCDLYPKPNVDSAFDVQKDWPFASDSAEHIYASHLLEHLDDPFAFFREAWRVLIPHGSMLLRMPYGGHKAAWWDLTHRRPWYPETFCFLQPGYAQAVGNPQGEGWRWFFGVASVDQRISGKFAVLLRWRMLRRPLLAVAENIENFVEELYAHLYALKTPEAAATYREQHLGNSVASRFVMYRHHLNGRHLRQDQGAELVDLGSLDAINGFHGWQW